MKAAVVATGTEITRGELVNSNASWLSAELTAIGIEVTEHICVDDDRERIIQTMRRLSEHHRVILCTGGLGPTSDDLTTDAVAKAFELELYTAQPVIDKIENFMKTRGRVMPEINKKQADFPVGSTILDNDYGTAPGFSIEVNVNTNRCYLACMPGVPAEMKPMFLLHVLPTLQTIAPKNMFQTHLRTFGMGESAIAQQIEDIEKAHPEVTVGYRAHFPEVEIKVLAKGDTQQQAKARAEAVQSLIKQRIEKIVYGAKEDSFASVVLESFRKRSQRLALAESCTGGLAAAMLTAVPGSSDVLLLSAVTYSNAAKTAMLGVSEEILLKHGAVSSQTAEAMASGALRVSGANIAVAITGIAGPEGGTDEKPVGTVWFGLAQSDGTVHSEMHKCFGDRDRIRTMAAYIALSLAEKAVAKR